MEEERERLEGLERMLRRAVVDLWKGRVVTARDDVRTVANSLAALLSLPAVSEAGR